MRVQRRTPLSLSKVKVSRKKTTDFISPVLLPGKAAAAAAAAGRGTKAKIFSGRCRSIRRLSFAKWAGASLPLSLRTQAMQAVGQARPGLPLLLRPKRTSPTFTYTSTRLSISISLAIAAAALVFFLLCVHNFLSPSSAMCKLDGVKTVVVRFSVPR